MLTFDEARAQVLATARVLGPERIALEMADGRVLAEDVVAPRSQPAFDLSAMDGYAVGTGDLDPVQLTLPVVGESAAGSAPAALTPGAACRIFTGAPLPTGADAVVMQEDVERVGDVVKLARAPEPGAHVRREGADLRAGAIALPSGRRLGPAQLALAASCDRATLLVARRPILAILASGNELRSPGEPHRPGSIPESNAFFVAAAARRAGADVRVLPFVRDDLAAATAAVERAIDGADLVCSIGGVSVGDHDVMRPAMAAAGVELEFFRVAIKPGKPLVLGRGPRGQVVLGLPGNPASASLTFLLFGAPLLRAMQGDPRPYPATERLPILGGRTRKPGRTEFARAVIVADAGGARVRVLPNQSSGAVTAFAEADALAIFRPEVERVEDGDLVDVLRLADLGAA